MSTGPFRGCPWVSPSSLQARGCEPRPSALPPEILPTPNHGETGVLSAGRAHESCDGASSQRTVAPRRSPGGREPGPGCELCSRPKPSSRGGARVHLPSVADDQVQRRAKVRARPIAPRHMVRANRASSVRARRSAHEPMFHVAAASFDGLWTRTAGQRRIRLAPPRPLPRRVCSCL